MTRIVFIVFVLTFFLSCSNDDSDGELPPDPYTLESIIGSWAYDSVSFDGQTVLYEHTAGCEKDMFQFYNEEGKLFDFEESYVMNCFNCADCAKSATNLKWELKGTAVELFFGEQMIAKYNILEVDETIIRYSREVDLNNDGVLEEVIINGVYYDPYGDFE